jgi:hypothetical protein
MSRAEYTSDLVTKDGPVVDVRAYGDALTEVPINLAITAIGASNKVLLIPSGAWTISNAITIPANVTLKILIGGVLTNSSTITIGGPMEVGRYQVFAGVGTVTIAATSTKDVYAEWFGATEGVDNYATVTAAIGAITTGSGVTLHIPTSLYTKVVVVDKADVIVDFGGSHQTFDAAYALGVGNDWDVYDTMFVANANNITFIEGRFYFGAKSGVGDYIWFVNSGIRGGGVDRCKFYNLPYDVGGVAVQVRVAAVGIMITNCYFENCCGSVSHQGQHGVIDNCVAYVTAAQVTSSPGVTDQAFGIDGSSGCSITNCKVIKTAGAPYSGACIGANTTTTNFVISNNFVYGVHGGVGIYAVASDYGVISNNVVDGGTAASVGAWALMKVTDTCSNIVVSNNLFRRPPATGVTGGYALDIATGNNIVDGNLLDVNDGGTLFGAILVREADTPAGLTISNNVIHNNGTGVWFSFTNNNMIPIVLKGNKYSGTSSTPYNGASLIQNAPIYLENEIFVDGAARLTPSFTSPKYQRPFLNSRTGDFPFSFGLSTTMHAGEEPAAGNYDGSSYTQGDIIWNHDVGTGGSPGWVCISSGTFSAASTTGGITTGTKALVLAAAAGFFAGDYITIAGVTGIKRIVTLVGAAATIDSNADATVAAAAVATPAPTFEVMGVLS